MSTIVNPAWKSKKDGEVVFKGETYTIGSDAFGSIEDAVAAGETSDLVIVDKKLTSPVKKQNITGAATDIFASTYTETDSPDGKTHTETVKFAAAAGGTASFKDDDATLVGFDKVTATAAGGSFAGGKLDISSSLKEVSDSGKGIETSDQTASVTSTATGSLSVTGKTTPASVAVSTIADSEGNTDKALDIIKDTFKEASGKDYEEKTGATYANVTLKLADLSSAVNGAIVTEKATAKISDTNSTKMNEDYSYAVTTKVGSGAATLTDANADDIIGFKTVKITTSKAVQVGDLSAENGSANYSRKSAYVADQSFTYNEVAKETESSAGSLTITGKSAGKEVLVDGEIEGFSSMNLKFATVNKEIEAGSESSNSSKVVNVKNQKGVAAATVTLSADGTVTADGSLTAANSVLGNMAGVKAVTISNSAVNGSVSATNTKSKRTKKVTGTPAGITDDAADYVDEYWNVDVDWDQAFTSDETSRNESSVGGTNFKISGKAAADSTIEVYGYKTVALENTDTTNTLTAVVSNDSLVNDTQSKTSFSPEKSYSDTFKTTTSDKAVGDATIKGKTGASVSGFASVKVAGTAGKTQLNGVGGQNTYSYTSSDSTAIKAGKENPVGSYTETTSTSNKAASTLDASNVALKNDGVFSDLKTVKLQGVSVDTGDPADQVTISGAVDSDVKTSKKFDWNAEEITATEAGKAGLMSITDDGITAWTESNDTKESAAGTFSLKNGNEIINVSAQNFKTVDVVGNIGKTTVSDVTGQDTYTDKWSKSLSVKGEKGTYSYSDTESRKAETSLTVSKATLDGFFSALKTVKLTDAAGSGTFIATVDHDEKSSKKFDWNTEEAAYKDLTPSIYDPAITAWTESEDTKGSAAGTFSLKNGSSVNGTVEAYHFKSVDVSGAIDHTFLSGALGQDTYTDKWSKSLSVKGAKGTYSWSETESSKAATTLNVSNATIYGGFNNLKSVTLKDVKVDTAPANFTASLDSDSKESKKIDWNAEDATFADVMADGPFGESVTAWTQTSESKDSIVGTFSLANSKAEAVISEDLSIDNFKTVDISGVAALSVATLSNDGDSSSKSSLKRTVAETKRAQEATRSDKDTSVGSLKVTGKSASPTVLTIKGGTIGYSAITLTDAYISGSGIAANSYAETTDYSAKETATLDSGTATVADLKVSFTHNRKGNGSFTANGSNAFTAFDGTLNGYTSISLKGKVSIGNVNNYKYDGLSTDVHYAPFNGEYFDVIAVAASAEPAPGDAEELRGNVSGTYKMDKNGQIESKWTASYATTATGSFSQTAADKNITAGSISGYDQVTLSGVKSAGDIDGVNRENTKELNYKYAKDEEVANSKVETVRETSASSVKLEGKTFGTLQRAEADSINGYANVTLTSALVYGDVSAVDSTTVTTTDAVNNPDVIVESVIQKAVGSLTASSSELQGYVSGFAKVDLKNTVADGISFSGGNYSWVDTFDTGWSLIGRTTDITAATGSFSAVSSDKSADPKLNKIQSVADIDGFAKVDLKDYNAGNVDADSSSTEIIPADDDKETPEIWKTAAATKGNSFTASAGSYVDGSTVKRNAITVGDVSNFGKVEATGLTQIGSIMNDWITDSVVFVDRIHSNTHYGDFTATAQESAVNYTAISTAAGSGVKVTGVSAATPALTALIGDVAGYSTVQLDYVELGNGAPVTFAGGNYAFSTQISDDEIVATSTSTANGKLDIKHATFVAGTTFAVEGFKTVAVDIAGAATFTKIIGGTETAQLTDGTLDFTTFKCADKAAVTTEEGAVTGKVAGFSEVVFTDTNFSGQLLGYEIGTKKVDGEIVQTQSAKTTITFDDADDGEAKNTVAGTITNAKAIVFKSSTADASTDFDITADITSLTDKDAGISGDLTITFDKCQATLDLSKLSMDDGDEIELVSSATSGAEIDLGDIADVASLESLIANMSDVEISGSGNILFTTLDEQDFADTLADAGFSWGKDVKFNGAHYDPTALA